MKTTDELSILEIKRSFKADKQHVFDALTKTEIMAKWFYGMPEGSARIDSEFRVGGSYTIHMFKPDGHKPDGCGDYAPHGEYLEIDPPNKVSFTWISEGFVDYSVVTITLEEKGDEVEMTLQHRLPEAAIPEHTEGWNTCLKHLTENCF